MRFNLAFALVAALSVSAAACGGDDDGLSPSGFTTKFGAGLCAKVFECMSTFPGDPADFTASFGADVNACKAGLVMPADIQAGVTAGRITFNEDAASSCVSMVPATTCDMLWSAGLPVICDAALVGTVANGGTCTLNAECVSVRCVEGTCAAPSVAGPSSEHDYIGLATQFLQ